MSSRRKSDSGQHKKGEKEPELTPTQISLLDDMGIPPELAGGRPSDDHIQNVLQRLQFVLCKQPKMLDSVIEILDNYDSRLLPCFQSSSKPSRFFYIVQGKDDD